MTWEISDRALWDLITLLWTNSKVLYHPALDKNKDITSSNIIPSSKMGSTFVTILPLPTPIMSTANGNADIESSIDMMMMFVVFLPLM
jgi:hypothetical protein